jgi:hypothetical protein
LRAELEKTKNEKDVLSQVCQLWAVCYICICIILFVLFRVGLFVVVVC